MSDLFTYRYCMWTADRSGVREHPQSAIMRLAPAASDFEPIAIADCWMFSAPKIVDPPPYVIEVEAGRYETSRARWAREHPRG